MNTLTHILIGTAAVGRVQLTAGLMAAAFAGAVFPDVSILLMVAWEMGFNSLSEAELWGQAYYAEPWVTYSAVTNSFFVFGGLFLIGWVRGTRLLMVFAMSAVLHFLGDIFLHYDDGHAHFWPLSNCVFYSPVSYWDPARYGLWLTAIEMVLALGVAAYLWPRVRGWGQRAYIGGVLGLMWAMSLLFFVLVLSADGRDDRPELSGPGKFVLPACPGSIDVARQPAQI